jgi:hypothetical protein
MICSASRGGKERRTFVGLSDKRQFQFVKYTTHNSPRTRQQRILQQQQLRHNTQDIQMRPIREEKIPQVQHLRQRRRASAEGQHAGKSINLGRHLLALQKLGKRRIDNGQTSVHQRKSLVHTLHRAADVAGAFPREKGVEEREGFGFGSGGVEEGSGEDIHALDVHGGIIRGDSARIRPSCLRIMQFPSRRIQHSRDARVRNPAFEQGVRGQGAKGIVVDFLVCGRLTAVDKGEIVIGRQCGHVEQRKPEIASIV